ncbi:NRDE family protein [Streptosporangium sp. NBC_01756]|uniref:NRDE family protein n=1 Tax=Streptosporangium sp. NBC_01756 TaxID=2975950 RepID=UPI002DDC4B54|nr:NRDE family protein [Streptosporangium sp. NBC_01756]WSC87076.1 NRDE family protein [Streptosporangium sp. NBC_01756]
MCTVVVSIDPDAEIPLILVGVRDEFTDRPWVPPAEHWPGLLGGRDLQAGGTWLAVDPVARRAAAIVNGHGVLAPEETRRSRGDLPLQAAAQGGLPDLEPTRYDPFHLILADPAGARLWHWDGTALTEDDLPPGTHMIVNSGWEQGEDNERVAFFRPRFAGAGRPADVGAPWGDWRELATGAGLPTGDPRSMIIRHELPDGRIFGSLSVTLLGLSASGVRYDFTEDPRDPAAFRRVLPE